MGKVLFDLEVYGFQVLMFLQSVLVDCLIDQQVVKTFDRDLHIFKGGSWLHMNEESY